MLVCLPSVNIKSFLRVSSGCAVNACGRMSCSGVVSMYVCHALVSACVHVSCRDTVAGVCYPHVNLSIPAETIWPAIEHYCRTKGDCFLISQFFWSYVLLLSAV